jgi:hypothetical protein
MGSRGQNRLVTSPEPVARAGMQLSLACRLFNILDGSTALTLPPTMLRWSGLMLKQVLALLFVPRS